VEIPLVGGWNECDVEYVVDGTDSFCF
jgi:hypothetical protein